MITHEGSPRRFFQRSELASGPLRVPPERFPCMLCRENTWEDFMIEVGANAPDFTLRSHSGEEVTLSQFRGDKWVVLHTFPLAFTGG